MEEALKQWMRRKIKEIDAQRAATPQQ